MPAEPASIAPPVEPTPPAAQSPEAPRTTPAPPSPAKIPSWEEDLDKLGEKLEPAPAPKPDDKPATPAPAGKKDEPAPPAKPASKSDEKTGIPSFQTNKDLRKWAEERHRAAVALETEKQQLQAKLQQLETVVPKTQQDTNVMSQTVAQMQKQIADYEQALATHVFEQSPKYINEFQKPYLAAREKAYREVTELLVTEETGERDDEDNPKTRQRPATQRDFDYIYSLPRAQARQAARKMFGDDADDVIEHRRKISDLAEKAIEAVENHRKNYKQELEVEMGKQTQQRNATAQLWRTANEKISADPKFDWLWGEDKEDPESNATLSKGFQMADLFFSEERDKMNPQDRVLFDANIRHRIAAFSRLAYKVNKLKADLDAANATIAQMRGSAPGKPVADAGPVKVEAKTWEEGLDALPE